MTADFNDAATGWGPHSIKSKDDGSVSIRVRHSPTMITATVKRADFLDAIARELGVTILDQADFPPVEAYNADADLCGIGTFSKNSDAEALEREGARYFAYAAHLRANPPVDEVQVGALADLLRTALGVTPETVAAGTLQLGSSDDIARRLIATGRVEVQP